MYSLLQDTLCGDLVGGGEREGGGRSGSSPMIATMIENKMHEEIYRRNIDSKCTGMMSIPLQYASRLRKDLI